MRIGFVFAFPALTGGHLAVAEIGTRLSRRGHAVTIVYPRRSILSRRNDLLDSVARFLPKRVLAPLSRRNDDAGIDWFDFPGDVVCVEELDDSMFPEFDFVVATGWQTAERIAVFASRVGRHVYFIQHYETWSGPESRVDATWRAPFVRIASSEWLRELGRTRFGLDDIAVVPYGVDLELFRPAATPVANARPRVGLLYHTEPWKGVADTLAALRVVRETRDVDVVAFGVFPRGDDLPPDVEYHERPTRAELAALYRSLDVFVAASWTETGPMTVPEAMASAACVVATDVGNVRLWSDGGDGAVIVPPHRRDVLAAAIADVLDDPVRRRAIARRGHAAIQRFTWDAAADAFLQVLEAHRR